MLYDTLEKLEARRVELEQPKIEALMKKASNFGGRYNKYHAILARQYGIEGDYAVGDYGDPEGAK